ncbi:3-hydroxyacyl-CoA dehydrogenase [Zhengella mangrovi]|nr:3-hydroxyacyl-CoA dehydrogenase [Zhengella mangrovi]
MAAEPAGDAAAYLAGAAALAAERAKRGSDSRVRKVLVCGAGAMGRDIALAFANAGRSVVLQDIVPETLLDARRGIIRWLDAQVDKGRLSAVTAKSRMAAIQFAGKLIPDATLDMVVEAVPEDLALKQRIMATLARLAPGQAILATNTSTLDIDAIAAATNSPDRVIGTHFFMPAQVTPLLELVPGRQTAPDLVDDVMALALAMAKTPVIAGNADGFIGNRLFDRFHQEAMFLLEEGALPEQVDAALERWGYAIGPFRTLDMIGNDIPWTVRKARLQADPDRIQPLIGDILCERGWLGQKSGAGWYRYGLGSRRPEPNPRVHALITQVAGAGRRHVTAEEIVARCVATVINEAAKILDEGLAVRGSDIDVVQVKGYGFPAARGGPMHFADEVGLGRIIALMEDIRRKAGWKAPLWQPSPLLVKLAASNGRLSEWEAYRAEQTV